MSTVAAPTTGYMDNGSLVQIGSDNMSEQWDVVSINKPNNTLKILIEGDLPSDKAGVSMSVSFFEGTIPLFSASGTWGIQGQSSSSAYKKNWKLKLKNSVTGNKLSLKIGDWFPMTSVTCKAYGTDRTLMRDSLVTDLWRQIHRYPTNLLAPTSAYSYFDSTDFGVHNSALFSTAGFPVEIWRDGQFLGLYVIRADNDPTAYLMDDTNQQHILTQPQHAGNFWSSNFWSGDWDFPCPNLKGYNTGDDISKTFPDINDATARVFNWMVSCVNGTTNFRDTYKSYIDLDSLLDWIIITELSLSFDSLNNNFMMGSWNATPTSGIWYFWPYDEDETFGVAWFLSAVGEIDPCFGWVCDDSSVNKVPTGQPPGIFKVCRESMRPELRARWAELRDAGIISVENITKFLNEQVSMINPDSMVADIQMWPLNNWTGNQSGVIKVAQSVSYIRDIAGKRISWIDKQWGYNPA